MHWADALAVKLAHRGSKHVIAAGITPSGVFHIGHLREVLTGEMVHRACLRADLDSEFVFVVDSADPLRKVYDFLDPAYEQWVGHQLADIPAPDAEGRPGDGSTSYSDHFLEPFLAALHQIGVRPRIIDNHASYAEGRFATAARRACDEVEEIRRILEQVSGREFDDDWFPYNPVGSDGSMNGVRVTGYQWPHVEWVDALGVAGVSDLRKGEGKLPWRVDWPARWSWIGVTCEPFGKDHGTAGGSYSTARPISELFGHEPPMPLTYEWISLKGVGAMSSSGGISIGPMDVLELVPGEVLRYFISRSKPSRHLDFDCGMSLFTLADEYERVASQVARGNDPGEELTKRQRVLRAEAEGSIRYSSIDIEEVASDESWKVPFRHLAMLAQIRAADEDVHAALARGGYIDEADSPPRRLVEGLARMRAWLASPHFPDEMRVSIAEAVEAGFETGFDFEVCALLDPLLAAMESCEWSGEGINSCIVSAASAAQIPLKDTYRLLYTMLLGRSSGPRLAPLLAELSKQQVLSLLSEASKAARG